jgi:hypothetical protein
MGVGAVLMQGKHPIAFISKSLGPKLRGLSTYEKEYIIILLAVDQGSPTCTIVSSIYILIRRL